MLREFIYSVIGISVVLLAYTVLGEPAKIIATAFMNLGAPNNIVLLSLTAFSLAFLALIIIIIIFMILRAVRKSYEVQNY